MDRALERTAAVNAFPGSDARRRGVETWISAGGSSFRPSQWIAVACDSIAPGPAYSTASNRLDSIVLAAVPTAYTPGSRVCR